MDTLDLTSVGCLYGAAGPALAPEAGTITAIDHRSGKVTVRLETGYSDLHLSPSSLRNLRRGDRLTLYPGVPIRD